jgi:hypothetical protein
MSKKVYMAHEMQIPVIGSVKQYSIENTKPPCSDEFFSLIYCITANRSLITENICTKEYISLKMCLNRNGFSTS